MSAIRQGRLKKAAALVPLALLSAAWTVSISTTGAPEATAGPGDTHRTLPDGTSVPAQALQIPASVSTLDSSALGPTLGVTGESSSQIVSAATTSSIPSAALAAYQRAETVIDRADPSCHLPWQLLGAIGRVESDHGRAEGNRLSAQGTAEPGIFGPVLDGTAGTARIVDTDGGRYDGDTLLDRAVGPMQFLPSTWSMVGVDADGDGQRNPQDIDDAALAAAVYLCSGTDDLSTAVGQRAAVFRYNHSASYVATVLGVMHSYVAGDYTAAPDATIPASYFVRGSAHATRPGHNAAHQQRHPSSAGSAPTSHASTGAATSSQSSQSSPSTTSSPSSVGSHPHTPQPSTAAVPTPSASPVTLPTSGVTPVDQVLTVAQATAQCTIDLGIKSIPNPLHLSIPDLLRPLGLLDDWDACIKSYTT